MKGEQLQPRTGAVEQPKGIGDAAAGPTVLAKSRSFVALISFLLFEVENQSAGSAGLAVGSSRQLPGGVVPSKGLVEDFEVLCRKQGDPDHVVADF